MGILDRWRRPKPKSVRAPATDTFVHAAAKFGSTKDKTTGWTFISDELSRDTIEYLYRGCGLARKIVTRLVDDALRQGFEINFPDVDPERANGFKKQLDDWQKSVRLKTVLKQHCIQYRGTGGALWVAAPTDKVDPSAPATITSLSTPPRPMTFHRHEVSYQGAEFMQDPLSPDFQQPKTWLVYSRTFDRQWVRVSRTEKLSEASTLTPNDFIWGPSVLQPVWEEVKAYGTALQGSAALVPEMRQLVYMLANIEAEIAASGQDAANERLAAIDLQRSIFNAVAVDKETEDLKQLTPDVTGLAQLLDRFMVALSAVTPYPMTVLFGVSPGGFGTGEGENRIYNDAVRAFQRDDLEPLIRFQIDWALKSAPFRAIPKNYEIVWPALVTPTDLETAQLRNQQAQTDAIYITNQVVTPEEVAESRFGGVYSLETQIDTELRELTAELRREELLNPDTDEGQDGEDRPIDSENETDSDETG